MTILAIVNGAKGRMGQTTCDAIEKTDDIKLVAKTGRDDDLSSVIAQSHADVVIDFTEASCAYENACRIIAAGARPVIGTSGLLEDQVATLSQWCEQQGIGGIIAPNFSIAAVLMMHFAAQAIRYYPDVEIIEAHHTGKQDSPSGTAIKTAQMLAEHRQQPGQTTGKKETLPGARGTNYHDIHIHALRLPGVVANQQIIFGGQGETLTIDHRSIDRECFMPGVLLSCREVMALDRLVYGLENVLLMDSYCTTCS